MTDPVTDYGTSPFVWDDTTAPERSGWNAGWWDYYRGNVSAGVSGDDDLPSLRVGAHLAAQTAGAKDLAWGSIASVKSSLNADTMASAPFGGVYNDFASLEWRAYAADAMVAIASVKSRISADMMQSGIGQATANKIALIGGEAQAKDAFSMRNVIARALFASDTVADIRLRDIARVRSHYTDSSAASDAPHSDADAAVKIASGASASALEAALADVLANLQAGLDARESWASYTENQMALFARSGASYDIQALIESLALIQANTKLAEDFLASARSMADVAESAAADNSLSAHIAKYRAILSGPNFNASAKNQYALLALISIAHAAYLSADVETQGVTSFSSISGNVKAPELIRSMAQTAIAISDIAHAEAFFYGSIFVKDFLYRDKPYLTAIIRAPKIELLPSITTSRIRLNRG